MSTKPGATPAAPLSNIEIAQRAKMRPIVPLGFEVSAYAVARRFENFKPNVIGRDYWNAWEWKVSSP